MATDQIPDPLPGDVIQITDIEHWAHSHFGLVQEVRRWGVGLVIRCPGEQGAHEREIYVRIGRGKFVCVGAAPLLPGDLSQARKDAVATARALAQESAPAPDLNADIVKRAGGWFVSGGAWSGPWNNERAALAARRGEFDEAHRLNREPAP